MSLQLVYFADPMCSWCWGFKPSLASILIKYGQQLPFRMIMGGLRPGTTKVMDEAQKASIRKHWEHVQETSGQECNFDFFERDDFVYDTEPACRSVVASAHVSPELSLDQLMLVQEAFYIENRDVTKREVLADIAEEAGMERGAFLQAFDDPVSKQETLEGFAITKKIGVQGFPTLLIGNDEHGYDLLTAGFKSPPAILGDIDRWLANYRAKQKASGQQ